MQAISSFSAVKGYLGATIQADQNDPQERQNFPAITITRQTGARAISIGNLIIEKLQPERPKDTPLWTLFEKDLIKRVLRENNLPIAHEKYFPEDPRNYIDEVIEEIAGLHAPSITINKECNDLIRKLCGRGHVIIVGRCGNMLTKDMSNVLKIRFVGSLDSRVDHLVEMKGLSRKVAENYLKKEDHLRKKFAKVNFSVHNIDDPHDYDLVINTDHLTDHEVVNMILPIIHHKENL